MFLTIQQAAAAMSCSKRTVQRMIAAGLLEFTEVGVGSRKSIRVKLPEPVTKAQQSRNHRCGQRKEYIGSVLKMPHR